MVRISSLTRQTRNTMAFTARLFMLLAIAIPILADPDQIPEVFPPKLEEGNNIEAVLQRIRDSCPPFGHPDDRFSVTVLGTTSPEISGCASMEPPNYDIVPSFNLWLGSPKTGGGRCGEKNMDHYLFECMAKHPFFTEEDTLEGWYVMLYDRTGRWTGRQDYRCALYETVNEDPPTIQMVISANQSCMGLSKRMKQSEHTVPKGLRHFADGSIALHFSKDLPQMPVWRKKRSEVQGGGCRFPDWSHGSWTDLKVDGSLLHYEPAFHEKDHADYGQENDDGKDGDTKATGGEQFMQRSQRHTPMDTVYQFRKKRELVDNEHDHGTKDIKQRKKRCNLWPETKTSTERYRDAQFENPKTGDPTEPSTKPEIHFGTTRDPTPRNKKTRSITEDVDTVYQLRKKRESEGNEHDHGTEDIKQRKKRCNLWPETKTSTERYRDGQFENPKTGDPTEPSTKPEMHFGTTRDPTPRNKKTRSITEDVDTVYQLRKKRESEGNEHDHGTEDIKQRKKRCNLWPETKTSTERYRDGQFENPKTGDPTEPSTKPEMHFGTTRDPTPRNKKKRSIIEDVDAKDDEEEALEKIKITDQINRRIRWWNIMRAIESIRGHALQQSNEDNIDKGYEVFPDNTPVPDSVRYLKYAETFGIPYKQALLNWRSLERAHRQRIAEVAYTAFPGQNHPDIVMRDFDQTFDGIEYDFNPVYPEGTVDDPTAYRALTLPGGYQLEPRLSRRTTFEQKQSSDALESGTEIEHFQVGHSNTLNDRTEKENTPSSNQRMRRSSTQQNQQQHATTTFTWRCEMAVNNDDSQLPQLENGAKFLTYGGHIVENNEMTGNDQYNEQDSKMSYGCLWLVPRGPNILEFSIIGTGMPLKNQSMQTFARQLCSENRVNGKETSVQSEKKLPSRRPSWVTETRTDDKKRVPVRCPVPPGIVFYGVVPAPPPNSTVSTNKDQLAPSRLCAKLVSSADECTTGQMGPADQMKYTVSECVEQDSSTGTFQTMVAEQTIFEASRGYTAGGSWRRNKRHSAPKDTSDVALSMTTTPTSSNMPFSNHIPTTRTIDNITDHQMTGSTTTTSNPMTTSSIISSSTGIQPFVDITIDPTNFTTTTATTLSTAMPSILPLSQEKTSPEWQLPSLSKSSTTTTTPSTSTATVTTTSSYHLVTDYYHRQQQQWQQQQWQQQHQQPNNGNNNNDYYYRGRQQHYPPPPPVSTVTDNNYYYIQLQKQQHYPQTQSHWLPQQHPIATNDYSNGYQHQMMDSGGHRTGDYYYRQQQQNYHNHQHINDRQQQTPQLPRNSSLTLQHSNGGSWNVYGDRPLYISSGGGGDNNRDAPVTWNSSTSSSSSSNNGGWTTAAQQHWWYQQQQKQQQQQQQQLQQQQRQQQNNRGLGGILSLPPVPLPPLLAEQGTVTISMPTPQSLHPRRQLKPPNHYYLPTLTTKTSSQPYQLRSKSESRYYQEREYQCLGQWTEPQEHISPVAGEKPVMLTYTFLKRLSPVSKEGTQYECFVGTPIPNDEGLNPETTTTILLTEAGTNTKCSRLSDPYRSGMKLVGTKIKKEGACRGYAQPVQDTTGGSWYSLKPQPISPSIPGTENGGGAWYAAPPVPVVAQGPTTMTPILTGRHTGGNGATFTSRQNEQTRRPQSANLPPKTNYSIRTVANKRIIILALILCTARRFFN